MASFVYSHRRHRRAAEEIDHAILRLSETCPAGLTEDQWAYCIVWTWNLNANVGHWRSAPTDDLLRIERELQQRIDRGADLSTIDWIWDEYVRSFPNGARYDRFRPTAPQNRIQFDAGDHSGNSLSFWREEYKKRPLFWTP